MTCIRTAARARAPELVCAAVGTLLRAVAAWQQWHANPVVRAPRLDALYYIEWGREIAAGHVLSAGPVGAGEPYLLNPLYAWLLGALALLPAGLHVATLVAQALLGGATAWITASAARRFAGGSRGAAWCAGLATAACVPLVHLATHVSVATLAAFLVAGALHALAPVERASHAARRGAVAGLWLGLGALARPVALLALPFAAWLLLRRDGRRAAVALCAAFACCSAVSFVRNVAVSGEPVVYTAADGQNLHLGVNPLARASGSMLTDAFRFAPTAMHEDARLRVALELGHEPSRREVSAWYRADALREVRRAPGAALAFYARKLRWFVSAYEPPSSADLTYDAYHVPWLPWCGVPWCVLAACGLAGAWVCRRDRELLLAALGFVAAHALACTLSFPLSHYRAPAAPALAVLAACGIARVRAADLRARVVCAGVALGVLVAALLPPQPAESGAVRHVNDAIAALNRGDAAAAARDADTSLRELPAWSVPRLVRGQARFLLRDLVGARDDAAAVVQAQPWNVVARRLVAVVDVNLGHAEAAVADLDAFTARVPWSVAARGARGELRAYAGHADAARDDLEWACSRGYDADPDALRRAGLAPR